MKSTNTDKEQFSRSLTRRGFLSTSLKAGAAAFTTGLLPNLNVKAAGQYNVLFIVVDDLRPLLGCYGHTEMHTPNIDALANRGTLFNRAYCQYPLCNPSRVSMMTGLRPDTTGVSGNTIGWRVALPNVVTLPQHFKDYCYHTRSVGKISHDALWDDKLSWSAPIWSQPWTIHKSTTPSWKILDVADEELEDGKIASTSINILTEIKEKPFFLAVGFHKPHLPYHVPRKYYDLYDPEMFSDVQPINPHQQNDIRAYADIPDGDETISTEKTLELMHGYAASTSYMDSQVGRILDHVEILGLNKNTVIAFCSDHGFHLGEHNTWRKNTLFEVALRSPLIISVPGQMHPGTKTDALVELVDIYPTLCDVCQLPIRSEMEGFSMAQVIKDPKVTWKTATFSQLGRETSKRYSMRTPQYRYTEWGINGQRGKELYDYYTDPNETVNLVNLPENSELVAHLKAQLHAGWRKTIPDVEYTPSIPRPIPWDVNSDGIVDMQDLIDVANSFGADTLENPKIDVNKDGSVDIIDLLIVVAHFGESTSPAAPERHNNILSEHLKLLDKWLTMAYLENNGSKPFKQGIATLEALLDNAIPVKTALLPNYPNPFNPETWIPYDLGNDANVQIDIYNLKGEHVRQLAMGNQVTGTYRSQSRAAHWDGRNSAGEPVASGVYVLTLQAGKFKATRRMVILK